MLFLALSNWKTLGKLLNFPKQLTFIVCELGLVILTSNMVGRINQTLNIVSVSQLIKNLVPFSISVIICNVLRDKAALYKVIMIIKLLMISLNQGDEQSESDLKYCFKIHTVSERTRLVQIIAQACFLGLEGTYF